MKGFNFILHKTAQGRAENGRSLKLESLDLRPDFTTLANYLNSKSQFPYL